MPPLWSKSTSSSIGRQRRESSAPLREVAPRPTLHRPSLCRAQIQVRAISGETSRSSSRSRMKNEEKTCRRGALFKGYYLRGGNIWSLETRISR